MEKKKYLPVVWYFLGFGLFMFTRSTMYVPFALVLAPVFILRFSRTRQHSGTAIGLLLLGFILSVNIALWGLRDTGDIVTALYFLMSLEGPFDGDAVFTHYFIGDLALKQLVSITGLWGLVFLVSWTTAVINWVWENRWEKTKRGLLIFSSILAGVFVFGGLKISPLLNSRDNKTVRIAAFTSPMGSNWLKMLQTNTQSPFKETIAEVYRLTNRAASGGAKIVAFQESTMLIEKTDENEFLAELGRIAKENAVYLSFTYIVFTDGEKEENRQVFLNDTGVIEMNYQKRYLLGFGPFGEAAYIKKGPGIIPVVKTTFGNIGFGTCKDMSFPTYARQAGRKGADILIDPSDDFPRSKGHVSLMRSIENGFSFIRPTRNGVSFAVDYHGNVLASKDYFTSSNEIMYADVPTQGIATVYTIIGDAFAWLCVLGFVAFVAVAIRNRARENREEPRGGVEG